MFYYNLAINQPLDLRETFRCGQCFRWREIEDNKFAGIVEDFYVEMTFEKGQLHIVSTKDTGEDYWRHYLDLDRDYEGLLAEFIARDDLIAKAYQAYPGMKILNQNAYEMLISFIISSNNNILRITKIIENLAQTFGEAILVEGAVKGYGFPALEKLAAASLEELKACNLGYRADYIASTSKSLLAEEADLNQLKQLSYSAARTELMAYKGIGGKVADCILLFGMEKAEAFPMDTWVKKIMKHFYLPVEKPSEKELKACIQANFGNVGGIIQQFLFHYIRNHDFILKNKEN